MQAAAIAVLSAVLSRRGGGVPAAVLPVAERLAAVEDLRVVAFEPPEEAAVPLRLLRGSRFGLDAAAVLRRERVRLVHTHGLWSPLSLAALRWRRAGGGVTIVSPHGMLDPWALRQSRWKKRAMLAAVERRHLDGSACIHALNAAEAAAIRAAGFVAPIAVVPNGIDLPDAVTAGPPEWMDRPTLLFLGRLHAKKGVSELIAGFARAAPVLPGWRLAIAGWDDGPNAFRAEAAASGADVVFPGPLFGADKARAYAHAAAFVLPSHSEGLPMTVLEAWAHRRPVLMTPACNLPEGFATGAAAVIEPEPAALAAVLAARLPDAAWRGAAGARGRRLVAERFAWDGIAAEWRAIYRWALGLSARPAAVQLDGAGRDGD